MKIAYIDSQNTHQAIKKLGRILDRKKFFDYLKNKYNIEKIIMFLGYLPQYEHFYGNLKKIGYTVLFKEAYSIDGKTIKGNVDIDIALEVAKDHFENRLQSGFLVTADGDYNSLVKFLKEKEKLAKVIIPGTHDTSRFLTRAAGNAVHDIGNLQHILSQ